MDPVIRVDYIIYQKKLSLFIVEMRDSFFGFSRSTRAADQRNLMLPNPIY